ncbi:unnamed protein product [Mucor circinelloides]|uniref:TM2 domain-containing protein n=1 Tax=Mucor circinelloides f. circinelloides (strain 1006PhL) TaxID=1220926 RepID=S2J9C3_MUCC1|nr:hypothetical protein HMPREF1544_08231 [Mucor circinelloides 1006PhL]KAG1081474.1 hypothetical protein G6F42_022931 [Rhizopus arrhizus]
MSNQQYGATANDVNQEESAPLISRDIDRSNESLRQKFQRITHQHRFKIIGSWLIVLAVTAALTVSLHYALKEEKPHIPEEPPKGEQDELVNEMCISDRSWFVALMLSIFLGPLGVDRFYLGYIFLGILKLITAGLGGIWWTIDVVLIALNVLNDHPAGCHLR